MKFDTKQKVLLAIYTEYQKDVPDMEKNLKAINLGVDNDAFKLALEKLENENLITGVKFIRGGNSRIPSIVICQFIMMTRDGIEYVEDKIGIKHTLSGSEKLTYILKESASWGWDQIKDIAARTLSEIAKSI
jgi:hypothetical protein